MSLKIITTNVVGAILITVVTGCAAVGSTFGPVDTGLPEGTRLAQIRGIPKQSAGPNILPPGGESLRMQRRYVGVFENAEVETYLNRLLGELQQHYPMKTPPARVYLTPASDFEAYVNPAGAIFVSIGALERLESEHQLAALIAHEYAHVLLSHARVGQVAGSHWLNDGPLLALTMTEQSESSVKAALTLREVVGDGIFPAYSRKQETDADLLGIDLLALAPGTDRVGMLRLLEKLEEWEATYATKLEPTGIDWRISSTKPINSGQTQAPSTPDELVKALSGWADDMRAELEAEVSAWADNKRTELARTHEDTKSRIATTRDYLREVYRGRPKPRFVALPWDNDANHPVRRLLTEAASMNQLEIALSAENVSSGKVRSALRGFSAYQLPSSAYGLRLEQLANIKLSNETAAGHALTQAMAYKQPLLDQLLDYVRISGKASPAEGLNALENVRSRFGDEPVYIPVELFFQKASGDNLQAGLLRASCVATLNKSLIERCEHVNGGQRPW